MTDILMRPVIALQIAVHELREREDGQTTTEYAILLGFLAIAIIVALFFLRNVLRGLFSDAASSVSMAPGPAKPSTDPESSDDGKIGGGRPAHAGRPFFLAASRIALRVVPGGGDNLDREDSGAHLRGGRGSGRALAAPRRRVRAVGITPRPLNGSSVDFCHVQGRSRAVFVRGGSPSGSNGSILHAHVDLPPPRHSRRRPRPPRTPCAEP